MLKKHLWVPIGFTLLYTLTLLVLFVSLPGDGYAIAPTAKRFQISQAPEGGALRPGDRIVAVEGQAFDGNLLRPGFWAQRVLTSEGCDRSACTYTVLRGGQSLTVQVPLKRPSWLDLLRRIGTYLFVGLSFTLPALFLALWRGHDRVGRLMALTLVSAGLSIVNNSIGAVSANLSLALFWLSLPIDLVTFWLIFSLALHIFLVFPQEIQAFKRRPWLAYPLHALNPVLSLAWALVLRSGPDAQKLVSLQQSVYTVGYPIAVLQLLGVIVLLAYIYHNTYKPLVRNQIRWIGWGVATGAFGWLALFVLPNILTGAPLVGLSAALLPLFVVPLSLTFAISRYRLLDIDSLINRSLVYGALSLFLIAFYFIDVAIISRGIQLLTGHADDTTVVLISTLTVAFAFAPARHYFQCLIDRAFYPSKRDFQRLFQQVSQELNTTIVVDDLVALLTQEIPRRLKVEGAVLYILDPAETHFVPHGWPQARAMPRHQVVEAGLDKVWLAESGQPESGQCQELLAQAMPGIDVCLPLAGRQGLIGLYGLGGKRSGDPYTGQEIEVLTGLSRQVAVSLENARLYRQVETYSKTLEELVGQRTRQLEQSNEALSAEKNKLDAVLNTIADGLIVTDLNGRISLVNPVAEGILGRSASVLLRQPLGAWVDDNSLMNSVIAALEQPGQVLTVNWTLEGRIFKSSSCALQATPEAGPERGASGVVTILRDVTHEVAVDRIKTEFVSTVSHELRTPLTSVMGFAKLVRRTFERSIVPELPDQKPHVQQATRRVVDNLDIIEAESRRLTRLINDVLDIAKIESGKLEWHKEMIALSDVIQRAVAATSALALEAEGDLPLLVDTPPNLPPLCGDPDRLTQVMANLLNNAIKFTDEGQITIRARQSQGLAPLPQDPFTYSPSRWDLARSQNPDDRWLVVSVTDTGGGIRPDDLSQVFEKFKQTGDTLTDRSRGTGLGLPICKEIVEHHGGVIWVQSQPGVGSTFSYALPVYNSEGAEAEQPGPAEARPAGPVTPSTSPTEVRQWVSEALPPLAPSLDGAAQPPLILVVDDDPNIRELLRQELNGAGYRVVQAADGVEALAQARATKPDLIVLDVMMPGVSGFDVTSALKADERTADIPILILSIVEDQERGLRLGADGYLTKPVDSGHLLGAIADLLKGDAGQRERKIKTKNSKSTAL